MPGRVFCLGLIRSKEMIKKKRRIRKKRKRESKRAEIKEDEREEESGVGEREKI